LDGSGEYLKLRARLFACGRGIVEECRR
jgi:hypothetical protein